jgi:hypothetical protein
VGSILNVIRSIPVCKFIAWLAIFHVERERAFCT